MSEQCCRGESECGEVEANIRGGVKVSVAAGERKQVLPAYTATAIVEGAVIRSWYVGIHEYKQSDGVGRAATALITFPLVAGDESRIAVWIKKLIEAKETQKSPEGGASPYWTAENPPLGDVALVSGTDIVRLTGCKLASVKVSVDASSNDTHNAVAVHLSVFSDGVEWPGDEPEKKQTLDANPFFLAPRRVVMWNDVNIEVAGPDGVLSNGEDIASFEAEYTTSGTKLRFKALGVSPIPTAHLDACLFTVRLRERIGKSSLTTGWTTPVRPLCRKIALTESSGLISTNYEG